MSPFPIRLVHVASGDLWAGAEVQLHYLARALHARREVQLHVVLLNHGELERRLAAEGISVEVMDERRHGPAHLLRALRVRLRESGAQVVHSHRYKENLLAALAARGTDCRAVRSIHSMPEPPHTLRAHAVDWADRLSARWQQAGVCVSPELPDHLRARLPRLPLRVIENGIDFAQLDHAAAAPVDEAALGDGIRVAFVARLVPIKRPDIFVAVAHQLSRETPDRFSFHLFGDGTLERECRDFVARHKLGQQVRLFGFRPDMPAWLARCDALVICSDHEGLPMVLLEAMGLGVPVISHAVGGIPHVLEAGKYGTLLRAHSVEAYATALRRLADAPEAALERARAARLHARSRYAIEAVADRYLALYCQLLGQPQRELSLVGPEATS